MGPDNAVGLVFNDRFASVVIRTPAVVSLCIAIILSVFKKRNNSWIWIATCVIGIPMSLSAVYPLATAHGSSASSSSQSANKN